MRKLASVRKVAEVQPIEGANAIEAVRVDGWWVVAKKGEFSVNDLAMYFEIDSWIPESVAPFLFKGREFNGVKGERLRTIKLRGQVSQGLLLPLPEGVIAEEGTDITEMLGIQKWEKPIPVQLQGQMRGDFPSFIHKTDQERIQNKLEVLNSDDLWEVTMKLDGSSMTVYWHEGVMGVCSRNIDLKVDQEGNTFVDVAKRIFTFNPARNLAIQGELMGPRIQGNRENLEQHEFFVFDIWDIDHQAYWKPSNVRQWCKLEGLQHVPVLHDGTPITGRSLEDMLAMADNTKSINHPIAEGLVFKRLDGGDSFKVISNKFLLKEKD
jgi:RNA ligase (TIGR02306 family)